MGSDVSCCGGTNVVDGVVQDKIKPKQRRTKKPKISLKKLLLSEKVEGVIFDLDDTLLDVDRLLFKHAKIGLEEEFGVDIMEESTLNAFVNYPAAGAYRYVYDTFHKGPRWNDCFSFDIGWDHLFKRNEDAHVEAKIYDGAIEFIESLTEKGIKIAISTHSPTRLYESLLTVFPKFMSYFPKDVFISVPITMELTRMKEIAKPSPYLFNQASKAMGIDPMKCAVFEDTKNGLLGAKAAGCFAVCFKNGANGKDAHEEADFLFSSYRDIIL